MGTATGTATGTESTGGETGAGIGGALATGAGAASFLTLSSLVFSPVNVALVWHAMRHKIINNREDLACLVNQVEVVPNLGVGTIVTTSWE